MPETITQVPSMLPPVDITKDRLVVFMGGTTFSFDSMPLLPDYGGRMWLTRFPDETPEQRTDKHYPRPNHFAIMVDALVGTVDEICEQLRHKLTATFNLLTMDGKAVIPTLGEASLRKQTEVIEQRDLVKNPYQMKTGSGPFNEWYNHHRSQYTSEDFKLQPYEADVLKRLVAMYYGLVHGDSTQPTSNMQAVTGLIAALYNLREDEAKNQNVQAPQAQAEVAKANA